MDPMLSKMDLKNEIINEVSKVSVVIPIYNTALYLRETLNTIVNQTVKDLEIICIDDKSSDDSWDILESYAASDKRFIIQKNPKNMGAAVTRNIGLQIATSKYIMFLDSDDIYDLRFIEKMIEKAELYVADMCMCSYKVFSGKPEKVSEGEISNRLSPKYSNGYNVKTLSNHIFQVEHTAPQYKLFRRDFLMGPVYKSPI